MCNVQSVFIKILTLFKIYTYGRKQMKKRIISIFIAIIISVSFIPQSFALTTLQQKELDKAVDKIMAYITPDMSDFEKVYALFLCVRNSTGYDYGNSENRYTAYGCLVNHTCVCEGYTLAFELVLNKADIKNKYQTGTCWGTSHAWNLVKLYDNWYHIDVTNGQFLMTDDEIAGTYTWTKQVSTPKQPFFGEYSDYDWLNDIRNGEGLILNGRYDKSGNIGFYNFNENRIYSITKNAGMRIYRDKTNDLIFYDKKDKYIKRFDLKNKKIEKLPSCSEEPYLIATDEDIVFSDNKNKCVKRYDFKTPKTEKLFSVSEKLDYFNILNNVIYYTYEDTDYNTHAVFFNITKNIKADIPFSDASDFNIESVDGNIISYRYDALKDSCVGFYNMVTEKKAELKDNVVYSNLKRKYKFLCKSGNYLLYKDNGGWNYSEETEEYTLTYNIASLNIETGKTKIFTFNLGSQYDGIRSELNKYYIDPALNYVPSGVDNFDYDPYYGESFNRNINRSPVTYNGKTYIFTEKDIYSFNSKTNKITKLNRPEIITNNKEAALMGLEIVKIDGVMNLEYTAHNYETGKTVKYYRKIS